MSVHETSLNIEDFDLSLLPGDQREATGDLLSQAIQSYFEQRLKNNRGFSQVIVTSETIRLVWSEEPKPMALNERAVQCFASGDLEEGIALLEEALASSPNDEQILLNLGMALSDAGKLGLAKDRIGHLLRLNPGNAHGWVALGVANARDQNIDGAIEALQKGVDIDSSDPYALKNLGAMLVQTDQRLDDAERYLESALEMLPEDQQLWLSFARLHEKLQRQSDADEAYKKVIDLNPYNPIAEVAKEARSQLAESQFRKTGGSGDRPDAVMYCLGALQRFEGKPKSEVQKVTFEIATLGMSGLDVNSPEQQYAVSSLPGKYSGLHLLCIEYVGFDIIDGSVDLGFDLSSEYEQAKQLHKAG